MLGSDSELTDGSSEGLFLLMEGELNRHFFAALCEPNTGLLDSLRNSNGEKRVRLGGLAVEFGPKYPTNQGLVALKVFKGDVQAAGGIIAFTAEATRVVSIWLGSRTDQSWMCLPIVGIKCRERSTFDDRRRFVRIAEAVARVVPRP
jgi:hypothetical protein